MCFFLFGVLASVTFPGSDNEPMKKFHSGFSSIPFCAITKLSFDSDQSGQITELLGEIGWEEELFGKNSTRKSKLFITNGEINNYTVRDINKTK